MLVILNVLERFKHILSAIDGRFAFEESQGADECESVLEVLGLIRSSFQGATLLLMTVPPAARHAVNAAFDRQHNGKQLAALHALANILGEARAEKYMLLNSSAEENLKSLIYEKASNTSRLTLASFLSVLQQDSEIHVGGYRLITGLMV